MDDLELEARLRTRLHARFDDAPVPAELLSNVSQSLTTAARPIGLATRTGRFRLGWAAVAAAVVIAVAAIGVGKGLVPLGPAGVATPSPATPVPAEQVPLPTASTERLFMVLAPGVLPDKATTTSAAAVLEARLGALGLGNFTSSIGNAMTFQVPGDGPSDEAIRAVLGATGDVEFVPVPPAASASLAPKVGDVLPSGLPALFGNEGIASVKRDVSTQGIPVLDITLTPAAATAFGDYTAAHIQESLAVVLDGRVALLPVITEPILDGRLQVASGGPDIAGRPDTTFEFVAAVLVGGRLPDAWQGARAPAIITELAAINAALGQFPGARFVQADLDAESIGDAWLAVWYIVVSRDDLANQHIPCPTPGPSGNACPTVGPSRRVVVNAEGGGVIRIENPPA